MKNTEKEIPLSKLITMSLEEINDQCGSWNFFDWFCQTSSLKGRAKRLLGAVRSIVKTGPAKFDPKATYVFFKNNCPCDGGLYDDLRICDMESGEVLFNVCPRDPWHGNLPRVAFDSDDGVDRWSRPLVFRSMKDLKAWFKDPSGFELAPTEVSTPGRWADDRVVDMCVPKAA